MKLTLQLRYHTEFGQSLWWTANQEATGPGQSEVVLPLRYVNEQLWETTLNLSPGDIPQAGLVYHYLLRDAAGTQLMDWGNERVITRAMLERDEVLIIDSWNQPGFIENVFYTEPFKQVLLEPNETQVRVPSPSRVTHVFKVKAPLLAKGQTLCLLGEGAALGNWQAEKPALLNRLAGEDFLYAELDLSGTLFPLHYKYGVYDTEKNVFLRYEEGANRVLHDAVLPGKQTIVNDGFAALPATTWKGAGVAIPVFSLRSEHGFGVGEFTDLKLLTDWCQQAGLKLIQLLPINDTIATHTWVDSYPYSAISAFALHPMYLNLERVASEQNKPLLDSLERERRRLNALEVVDYPAVVKAKLDFLRRIYPSQKAATFTSQEYQQFFAQNQHWLVPYAVFSWLREKYGTADFNQWPAHKRCRTETIEELTAKGSASTDEIAFYYFIQFHLHRQLQEATEYAHVHGVILKGDIPIGVYRNGADAWQAPELYHMDVQAGAPPDPFSDKGQNWSFPTYNWPRMEESGFAWWKERFAQMGHYFDAFRIDHILGFFRIWSIPLDAVEGILGYFVPALPVHLDEFAQRGIAFDRDRFLQPYITDPVLEEIFGEDAERVKAEFLQPNGAEYRFKPPFATQRQVEQHFAALEQTEANRRLKEGLFDLVSNVILLEVKGSEGRQFHFRFFMEKTASFRHLDQRTQERLRELYIDYFFRRQEEFWRKEAMEKLPALKRGTNMLVCGEDLGLVPQCVPEVMKQLGLLSLEVQRMPKGLGQEFSRPKDAPYLSVVTPSTHDMSTIRGWWQEDPKVTQKFYSQELGQPGLAPRECAPWINKAIVLQHLASPAMWSIFQLQDLLGVSEHLRRKNPDEERINVPANPKNYWRYRMHVSLETLVRLRGFSEELRSWLAANGRAGQNHEEAKS